MCVLWEDDRAREEESGNNFRHKKRLLTNFGNSQKPGLVHARVLVLMPHMVRKNILYAHVMGGVVKHG